MKPTFLFILAVSFAIPALAQTVLPDPQTIQLSNPGAKSCPLSIGQVDKELQPQVNAFKQDNPGILSKSGTALLINKNNTFAEEEYKIFKTNNLIKIRVGSPVALAWALQTVSQLQSSASKTWEVHDKPDTPFRAVMLDVARRYYSPSTLCQAVRWCQLAKIRYLQLHLTDDQNWMLPTQVLDGIDKQNSHGHPAYTNQQLSDMQKFAQARGVTLIPEIDIPGHSTLLVKYDPALFRINGSQSTNCINFGSSKVRGKMKALLKEVATLFRDSPYIHIGSDEAWYPDAEKDPDIARSITSLGQGRGPGDVFVDFVADMSETVLAIHKTPIVWEGFGKSDFVQKRMPKQTVVISWEGNYYPPQDLSTSGFRIINAGWDPCYIVNHFPYESYTLVPLPTLYKFAPQTFGIVSRADSNKFTFPPQTPLIGSMLCWWEGHEWNAQTTLPQRILAFGSRLWNTKSKTPYQAFLSTSTALLDDLQTRTVPFKLNLAGTRPNNPHEFTDHVWVTPTSTDKTLKFGIRTDGQVPKLADVKPSLKITDSGILTVRAFRGNNPVGEVEFHRLKKVTVVPNLAMGKPVECSTPEDPQFPARLVVDGVSDDDASFWLGYPNPSDITIDLGKPTELNRIDVVPFWPSGGASQYIVSLSSDKHSWTDVFDGKDFKAQSTVNGNIHRFNAVTTRYIRVRVLGSQTFPTTMARIHEIRAFFEK